MIYLFSQKIRRPKNKKVDFEKTQSTPNTIFNPTTSATILF